MLTLPDFPVRQRDFLLEISRAITAQLDVSEVLRRVLHASIVMIAGRVGLVALRDPSDNMFYVRAYAGISGDRLPEINEKMRDLVEGASSSGDYNYLNEKLAEMARTIDPSLQQSVAMPLIFAGKPLGLLVVFRSYQATVTPNDIQIMQSFADQAAIAVHNAQLYDRINRERQRLAALLQHSGDGVLILDVNLNVLQINQAFERMVGRTADEAVGREQDEVIVWAQIEQESLAEIMSQGWPNPNTDGNRSDTHYVEGEIVRPDGTSLSIGITYAPLFDAENRLINIIANVRDITNFRRAQRMQNVFISTISHELRTPVALIKGYASTLNRDDAHWDADIIRNSLSVIEDESDRLTELIEDLLTASKIQAERGISLQLADVALDHLAAYAVERFRSQTQRHNLILSFPDHFPTIQGDSRRLRQVVDNLVANAIKYSPDGGTITIGGRFTDENVTVFVRDQGVGISKSEIPRVFERFYRVQNQLTAKTKGTGLGLYLVKAIIEAHGGTMNVKSNHGQGSTFYFTIPRDEPRQY